MVEKFGYDKRRAHYSSLVLTGQLSRDEALKKLEEKPYSDDLAKKDLAYICQKLNLTKDEFLEIINQPNKTYQSYKNSSGFIAFAVKMARLMGVEKRQYR